MGIHFEWDPKKARSNLTKHGVSFEEAATVFGDLYSITVTDPDHSEDEIRFLIVGRTHEQNVLVVAFTEREPKIRIISARKATKSERKMYEKKPEKK